MKKKIVGIGIAALLLLSPALPRVRAFANSAPAYWSGSDGAGVVLKENCPIEVESEKLSFRIRSLPETAYASAEEFSAYDASVTAEYVFYNPTKQDVTAQLAFPFGKTPDFLIDDGSGTYFDDVSRYHVRVAGADVHSDIRYTYLYGDFSADDVSSLLDEKMTHGFFSENAELTEHVYDVQYETADEARLELTLSLNPSKTRLLFDDLYTWDIRDGYLVLQYHLGETPPRFYSLGEEPVTVKAEVFSYTGAIFSDKGEKIASRVDVQRNQSLFSDWVEQARPAAVNEVDWFNCAVCYLERRVNDSYGSAWAVPSDLTEGDLMRWFEYSLTVPAGGHVVNSVTAPLYPSISGGMYRYTYLLSPATRWADFGTLDVVIDTAYEITESSLALTKTESGYRCTRAGLPLGELEFRIEQSASGLFGFSSVVVIALCVFGGLLLLGGIAGAVVGIVFGVRRRKKKKNG